MKRFTRIHTGALVLAAVIPALILSAACGRAREAGERVVPLTAGSWGFEPLAELAKHDVRWDSVGGGSQASMPLGNGDIGLNVWAEKGGDVCFYISKTDSWDESGRLLKLGRVRIHLDPGPFLGAGPFLQALSLRDATVTLKAGSGSAETVLSVWVDAHSPTVRIEARVPGRTKVTAGFETWRTKPETLKDELVSGLNYFSALFPPTVVQPDTIVDSPGNRITWYHRNPETPSFLQQIAMQGLDKFPVADPLKDRIFGGVIEGDGFVKKDAASLVSERGKVRRLNVHVLTRQPETPAGWLAAIGRQIEETNAIANDQARRSHETWWQAFWSRSWIFVRGGGTVTTNLGSETEGDVVTRGYILQRFINACAGRGQFPIKFNGSLFTVESEGGEGFADYRRWGPGYWWQNTRLPYMSMPASGDFDLMQPFFRMYSGLLPLCLHRTKLYFGHDGAYFPECINFWGAVFTETWGDKSLAEMPERIQASGYHKYEWVGGLEMAAAMLEYYLYDPDRAFLRETALPFAEAILTFFVEHYKTGPDGKLVLKPSQALETWWDCTNAMPEVAGLHDVVDRMKALPPDLLTASQTDLVRRLTAILPDIPTRVVDGARMLAPAASFAQKQNVENPELYAVYPFKLYGLGRPDIELAIRALDRREDRGHFGWRQDDLFMALLGLTDRARKGLVERAGRWDKDHRFPAFWGPNYDWTPDQDHGGVLMKTLQTMLLQCDGKDIRLLPAWPADWDVDFKLRAPQATFVEGQVRGGKLVNLLIEPSERTADVVR
jgi:alpha-L-fucosidase 2